MGLIFDGNGVRLCLHFKCIAFVCKNRQNNCWEGVVYKDKEYVFLSLLKVNTC